MKRTLTCLLLTLTCAAAAGPIATASAASWNDAASYLHFSSGNDRPCTKLRKIRIASGWYRWRGFVAHWAHPKQATWKTRKIYLRRGWYKWGNCMGPWNKTMRLQASLQELRTGGFAELFAYRNNRFGDGTYHFGSALSRW